MSAEPFVYNIVLDYVTDGDTIKASKIDLGFSVSLQNRSIRIAQIDTPESRINHKKIS
jgi:endonuclease YncB( thermonuclease family)